MASLFDDFGFRVLRNAAFSVLLLFVYWTLFSETTPEWAPPPLASQIEDVFWGALSWGLFWAAIIFVLFFFDALKAFSLFDLGRYLEAHFPHIPSDLFWVSLVIIFLIGLLWSGYHYFWPFITFSLAFIAFAAKEHEPMYFLNYVLYYIRHLAVPYLLLTGPVYMTYKIAVLTEHPRFRELFSFGKGASARWAGLHSFRRNGFYFSDMVEDHSAGGEHIGAVHSSIYLGRTLFQDTFLPQYVGVFDDAHMLTVGATGSGKSTTVLWPNLITYKGSAFVIDPKGEHARRTLGRRQALDLWRRKEWDRDVRIDGLISAKRGTDVRGISTTTRHAGSHCWLLDPFGEVPQYPSASYNPLEEIDIEDANVRGLISAISDGCVLPEGQKDVHFFESAKTVLEGFIAHVVSRHPKEEQNLPFIYDLILGMRDSLELAPGELPETLEPSTIAPAPIEPEPEPEPAPEPENPGLLQKAMGSFIRKREVVDVREREVAGTRKLDISDPNALDELLIEMRTNGAAGGLPQLAANVLDRAGDKERGSIMTTVFRSIKWVSDPAMRKALEDGPFTFKGSFGRWQSSTAYIVLPERFMNEQSRWMRTLINLSIAVIQQAQYKKNLPVLYILDEFPRMGGKLKMIEEGIVTLRAAGIKLWPIIQNIGQLKRDYGANWETFVSSSNVQLFGVNDMETAKWASERIGKRILTYKKGVIRRRTTSKETVTLITHDEIMAMCGKDANRQIVIPVTGLPMRLERLTYKPIPGFNSLPLEGHYDDF